MSRLFASRQTRRAGGKTMPRFPRHHPSVQQRRRTSNRRISSGAPKALLNQRFRSGPHPCDSWLALRPKAGLRPRRISNARAMEDSVITRVDKATMARMLRDQPNFSERFTAHLLARTIRVEEDLVDQLFNSSEKRLARALLLLANFGKDGKQEPVIAQVSQETLADMIGTTRSRVSHFPQSRSFVRAHI